MINCVFQQRIKKVLAVQSCSQATEKTKGGEDGWKDGWKEEGKWRSWPYTLMYWRHYSSLILPLCNRSVSFSYNSNTSHPSSSLLPLQRPKQSLLSHSFLFSSFPSPSYSRQISFPCPSSSSVILYPIVVTLSIRHQLLLLRFHPCSSSSSSSTSLHGEHQEAGEGGVFPSSH